MRDSAVGVSSAYIRTQFAPLPGGRNERPRGRTRLGDGAGEQATRQRKHGAHGTTADQTPAPFTSVIRTPSLTNVPSPADPQPVTSSGPRAPLDWISCRLRLVMAFWGFLQV